MLSEILDQWEVLVELQRQKASWQSRWDQAIAVYQNSLKTIPAHDAERLHRVLCESLPEIQLCASTHCRSASAPTLQADGPTQAKPEPSPTFTTPVADDSARSSLESEILVCEPTEASQPSEASEEAEDFDALFDSVMAEESPASEQDPGSTSLAIDAADFSVEHLSTYPVESDHATSPSPKLPAGSLLEWATETIGDGLTENQLFQALRSSPFSSEARGLFELLKEREAFYETDDGAIHVRSIKHAELLS